MKPLIERINSYITTHNLIPPNATIVLGLSGGPDSVFLAHILADMQKKGLCTVIATHLDHQWRTDSSQDVQFCLAVSEKLEIPFITNSISNLAVSLKFNGSKEELGRKMRRHFFEKIKKEHNAHAIALAHHADDQQETFFIRLMRGASLTGLTGMKPKHGHYIRPLLEITKAEILDYLKSRAIDFRIDPTNGSDAFLRNRIRSTIIPACVASDARFAVNFNATLARLQETETFLKHLTHEHYNQLSSPSGVKISQFLAIHPVMQQRILLHWLCQEGIPFPVSEAFFDEIIRFLTLPHSGTHQVHPGWNLIKSSGFAKIEKN